MNGRIKDKIAELEILTGKLEEICPKELEAYLSDDLTRAACERYFEKIVESIVSLSFTIIREKKLDIPEDDDKMIFETLERHKIIPSSLSSRLKNAKGMRNILAREYGRIDDKRVFEALTQKIIPDTEDFLNQIRKAL